MASKPNKPRARSRKRAGDDSAAGADAAALPDASGVGALPVAVIESSAGTPAEAAPPAAAPLAPEEDAAAMAVALAALPRGAEEDDEQVDDERIVSVRELLALGTGAVELLLFRVGRESFAFDLVAAEEAVELEGVHPVPDMPDAMLGVFDLRGRLIPVYSPAATLCTPTTRDAGVLLLMRAGDRRIGIVVDDVEDVVPVERGMIRPPPVVETDGIVLGVAFVGDALITILDAHALIATCAVAPTPEAV